MVPSESILPEEIECVYAGSKSLSKEHLYKVTSETRISDAIVAIGSCTKVLCLLKSKIVGAKTTKSNVFDHLMTNAAALKLPEMRSENDGRDALFNSVVSYLEDKKLGFRVFQKSDMECFMSIVTSVLWYMDGQWTKFSSAPGVSSLPENLRFAYENHETFRKLHFGNQLKKSIPRMKKSELIEHFNKLEMLTTKTFLKSAEWKSVLEDLCCLKTSLAEYVSHINRAEENLKSDVSKGGKENRSLKSVPANLNRKPLSQALYNGIEEKLKSLPPYVELNVIFYAPTERRAKFNYISAMEFGFPIQIYRSFKPMATFVWRSSPENETAMAKVIANIENDIEKRVENDKVMLISKMFGELADWSPQNVRDVVSFMSGKYKICKKRTIL